jgi:hypothetical protein
MGKVAVCVIALYVTSEAHLSAVPASPALTARWRVIPLRVCTPGSETIFIDRVTDVCRQASSKAGGLGNRYTCVATMGAQQREIYLYKDEDDWFLEEDF